MVGLFLFEGGIIRKFDVRILPPSPEPVLGPVVRRDIWPIFVYFGGGKDVRFEAVYCLQDVSVFCLSFLAGSPFMFWNMILILLPCFVVTSSPNRSELSCGAPLLGADVVIAVADF